MRSMPFTSPRPKVCDRARTYVSLRLDCELSDFERALLSSHLAACASCTAFAEDLAGLTGELRSAPLQRLERPLTLPGRVHTGLRRLQLGAAAAVLVSVIGAASLLGASGADQRPRFETARSGGSPEPSLRELRANDLRPQALVPRGVKILQT